MGMSRARSRSVFVTRSLRRLDLQPISHPFYVDDALFVRADYWPDKEKLELILSGGNSRDGYFDLILNYGGVEITLHDLAELARAARGARTSVHHWHEAYCHEFNLLPDGRIEHGFIFQGRRFNQSLDVLSTIRCQTLTWERIERPDRTLPRFKDRFRIVGTSGTLPSG